MCNIQYFLIRRPKRYWAGRAGLGSQIGASVNELLQYCRFIATCLADGLGQIMPLVATATKKRQPYLSISSNAKIVMY